MNLHLPSAITITALVNMWLSLNRTPASRAARPRDGFRMVCAGLPVAPLISRWARALWSAGPPAHTFNTLARGVYSLQFPPVDIDGLMCADAITPKRLWRFPGSQVLDRWRGCWTKGEWLWLSQVAKAVPGKMNLNGLPKASPYQGGHTRTSHPNPR